MMAKLLLVDDDDATRDALKRTLRTDFDVLEASNAAVALEILAQNQDVAIVVADEKMPDKSGTELLNEIKIKYPGMVRVILSGHIRLEQMMIAINSAEIHRFILKPWDNELLRLQLGEALLHHRNLDEILRLQKLAVTDPVTGLTNHRFFQERIREEIERSSRHGRIFSLIMVDVDHFKTFNDKFGHPEGDKALAHIAHLLKRATRVEDSVSRYGGEEFAIILPETGKKAAAEVAERVRTELEDLSLGPKNEPVTITLSMGVSSYPDDSEFVEKLIEAADRALYAAKRGGRNRVELAQK